MTSMDDLIKKVFLESGSRALLLVSNDKEDQTTFEEYAQQLTLMINSWRDGQTPVTNAQCEDSLKILHHMSTHYSQMKSHADTLSLSILEIQQQLKEEKKAREENESKLLDRIVILEDKITKLTPHQQQDYNISIRELMSKLESAMLLKILPSVRQARRYNSLINLGKEMTDSDVMRKRDTFFLNEGITEEVIDLILWVKQYGTNQIHNREIPSREELNELFAACDLTNDPEDAEGIQKIIELLHKFVPIGK